MVYTDKMTLGELAQRAAAQFKKRNAFEIYGDGLLYDRISYEEFGGLIRRFAALLLQQGVQAGDRVMILAENRPEWPVAYFGIALAGAVSVPVLTEFIPEHIERIAVHGGVAAICISAKTAPKAAGIDSGITRMYIDDLDVCLPEEPAAEYVFPDVKEEDPASIIYTSGTTGSPKGVVLSHRNFLFTALATRSIFKIFPRDRFLSMIPLAHTYECTEGMIIAVMSGASVTYLDKPPVPAVLIPAMQAIRPTVVLTVPLIIEKIYRNRILPALQANPLYKLPLTRSIAIKGEGRTLVRLTGGAIRFFSIGGAALAEDVELFLRQVQFPYTLGYGMTEAAPLLAGTAPFKSPVHSAGKTLKGVELRIAEGGEIQARGPNIMLGYYRDEQRTRDSFTEDGWFKTGDIGHFDKKGRLYIRGRLKALILGPSGENIYPEEIEEILHTSEIVEEALVIPGERGELVALIVLSEKAQTMLAAIGDTLGELKNAVNKRLAAFSRINRIEVRSEPFEKTATQKIKRFLYGPKDRAPPDRGL